MKTLSLSLILLFSASMIFGVAPTSYETERAEEFLKKQDVQKYEDFVWGSLARLRWCMTVKNSIGYCCSNQGQAFAVKFADRLYGEEGAVDFKTIMEESVVSERFERMQILLEKMKKCHENKDRLWHKHVTCKEQEVLKGFEAFYDSLDSV